MDCPRCSVPMKEVEVADIRVDLCSQCEGSWYDAGELGQIFAVADADLENSDLSATLVADSPEVSLNERLRCPRCSEWMIRYNYLHDSPVMVDGCSKCGLWLDDGELGKIIEWVAQSGTDLQILQEPRKEKLLTRIVKAPRRVLSTISRMFTGMKS